MKKGDVTAKEIYDFLGIKEDTGEAYVYLKIMKRNGFLNRREVIKPKNQERIYTRKEYHYSIKPKRYHKLRDYLKSVGAI